MHIVSLETVDKIDPRMEGAVNILKQMPISKKDGTPNFSFRVFTIQPGGCTPYHKHGFEHLNYIIGGKGGVINESGEKTSIGTGDFALILPNEMHQYVNTSDSEDFVFICAVPKDYE